MTFYNEFGEQIVFYDDSGVAITLEAYDTPTVLEALNAQTETLEALKECQADILSELKVQNATLTEMNTYVAYIFAIITVMLLYKVLSAALSAMFGGG